ncbi:MAG: hypothetical protein IJ805_04110 [Lachnospiraceae bacterium]|nr:hypothetical protein [Lachnospiraceae bacterium]
MGIPVRDGLKIQFHSMSLPTANLIWHCPYITIYHSSDKKVNGDDYRNTITVITENMGIYIKNVTTIEDDTEDIYVAITGDQVALTNIRIM